MTVRKRFPVQFPTQFIAEDFIHCIGVGVYEILHPKRKPVEFDEAKSSRKLGFLFG